MPIGTNFAHTMMHHFLGGPDQARTPNIKIALYTASPNYNLGTGGTECADTNYSRQTVVNSTTNFPAPANRKLSNGVRITFAASGFAASQTIVGWGAFDDTNNYLMGASFASVVVCAPGQPVYFDIGDLSIEFS